MRKAILRFKITYEELKYSSFSYKLPLIASFKITYEELKSDNIWDAITGGNGFKITYEELKSAKRGLHTGESRRVLRLPMRN